MRTLEHLAKIAHEMEERRKQRCEGGCKILAIGSRTYGNYNAVRKHLEQLMREHPNATLITGDATGADALVRLWAKQNRRKCEVYRAEWETYGRRAGPIRNAQMVESADYCIAFTTGQTRGTADTLRRAIKKGIPAREVPEGWGR